MAKQQMNHSRRRFLLGTAAALSAPASAEARAKEASNTGTTDEWIRQQADKAPLALTFRGHTAEEGRKWQAEFAAKLRSLLGPHAPPTKWKTLVRHSVELDDHRREELRLIGRGS
jgi:hypothetical protein